MEGRPLTGPAAEFKKRLEFALLMRDIRALEAKEKAYFPQIPILCDCERSQNGLGFSGRECECELSTPNPSPSPKLRGSENADS